VVERVAEGLVRVQLATEPAVLSAIRLLAAILADVADPALN
jgi:hypothetical protein